MSRLDLVTFRFSVECRCAIGIVAKWCDFPPCDVTFLHLAIPLGDVTFLRVMWLKPGARTRNVKKWHAKAEGEACELDWFMDREGSCGTCPTSMKIHTRVDGSTRMKPQAEHSWQHWCRAPMLFMNSTSKEPTTTVVPARQLERLSSAKHQHEGIHLKKATEEVLEIWFCPPKTPLAMALCHLIFQYGLLFLGSPWWDQNVGETDWWTSNWHPQELDVQTCGTSSWLSTYQVSKQ